MLKFLLLIIFYLPYKLLWWSKWINKKELRKYRGKPVILALNHRSGFDGPAVLIDVHRNLKFWVKGELFDTPFRRGFWRGVGGIPVRSGAELALMRNSKKVLDQNIGLVVLPEGHRNFDSQGKVQIKNGVAMVALHAGVPIIPIVTDRRIAPFRLTRFKVGTAIDSTQYLVDGRMTKEAVTKLGNELQTQMSNLLEGFEKKRKLPAWQREPSIISRGIVIRDQQLLAIKRQKNGETYYVLPGGHAEPGETEAETCAREVLEETGVIVRPYRALFKYWYEDHHGRGNGWQTFYIAEYKSGEPHKTDAEEYTQPNRITGTYDPLWLDLAAVKDLDLRPAVMKKELLRAYRKKGARLSVPMRLLKDAK